MEIQTLPEMKLAGLVFAGRFEVLGIEMPKLWSRFLSLESGLGTRRSERFGVHMQEHGDVFIECIAAPVDDLNSLPPGMVALRIPERRYAVFTHTGPMSGVRDTYLAAFAALEQAGLAVDPAALRLERYDTRYIPTVHDNARAENAYDILFPLL